jgi:hypothetical protein
VVGWLLQNIKSHYRLSTARNWTPDGTHANYWELWTVIQPASVVPTIFGGVLDFSGHGAGHHDAFCIGDVAIRNMAPPPSIGGDGAEIVYRKIGRVYFVPWDRLNRVNRWLRGAQVPGTAVSGAGGSPMSKAQPSGLPAHGLRRVAAITYQRRSGQMPRVAKWDQLRGPSVPYY